MTYRPSRSFLALRRLALYFYFNGLYNGITEPIRRFFRYLRKNGFRSTLKRLFNKAPAPQQVAPEIVEPQVPHPFDRLHGTDTGGSIGAEKLSTVSLSAVYSTEYLGIMPSALTQALSALSIPHEEFTFVDLGCGKGRALLVAARFPFRHLFGVELAGELCDIARVNVAITRDFADRISILNQDAASVTYPDGPLLLFLYHPFFAPVLRRVLANLERQLRKSQRPAFVLYAMNPRYTEVMDSFPFLREISDTSYAFSPEEAPFDQYHRTEEQFTLYSADFAG